MIQETPKYNAYSCIGPLLNTPGTSAITQGRISIHRFGRIVLIYFAGTRSFTHLRFSFGKTSLGRLLDLYSVSFEDLSSYASGIQRVP